MVSIRRLAVVPIYVADFFPPGYLAWDYRDFKESSQDIKLAEGGTKLEARLRKQDHEMSAPQGIWLNERIINRDGRLHFGELLRYLAQPENLY